MFRRTSSVLLMMTALLLAGCVGGRSPSARFFQLQPAESLTPTAKTPLNAGYAVILRPVSLDPYLNRPQMVNRISPYEIKYREFERWAEPLDGNITRVLAENLRRLLQTDRVAIFPHAASDLTNITVNVDISRFEGTPGDQAILHAAWVVRIEPNGKAASQYHDFRALVAHPRIEETAAAQADLLTDLSHAIAADILSITTPEPATDNAAPAQP